VFDLGAKVGVGVDELPRDTGVPGDRRDRQLMPGGQLRVDGGGDALAFDLAVQSSVSDHRVAPSSHGLSLAGRGWSVGRDGRVMPW